MKMSLFTIYRNNEESKKKDYKRNPIMQVRYPDYLELTNFDKQKMRKLIEAGAKETEGDQGIVCVSDDTYGSGGLDCIGKMLNNETKKRVNKIVSTYLSEKYPGFFQPENTNKLNKMFLAGKSVKNVEKINKSLSLSHTAVSNTIKLSEGFKKLIETSGSVESSVCSDQYDLTKEVDMNIILQRMIDNYNPDDEWNPTGLQISIFSESVDAKKIENVSSVAYTTSGQITFGWFVDKNDEHHIIFNGSRSVMVILAELGWNIVPNESLEDFFTLSKRN